MKGQRKTYAILSLTKKKANAQWIPPPPIWEIPCKAILKAGILKLPWACFETWIKHLFKWGEKKKKSGRVFSDRNSSTGQTRAVLLLAAGLKRRLQLSPRQGEQTATCSPCPFPRHLPLCFCKSGTDIQTRSWLSTGFNCPPGILIPTVYHC